MRSYVRTKVPPEMYGSLFKWVYFGYGLPILFLALDLWLQKPDWFARSGAITVFIVACIQFRQMNLLQNKILTNAQRARNNESISLLSDEYQSLGGINFWAGLYGTAIWAYGDKLITGLLAVI